MKKVDTLDLSVVGDPVQCTLSSKSLSPLSSVCFKTTQTTGSVGVAGDCPPTSKLRTFL